METKLMLHQRGECKPCAYFHHKEDGCRQGEECPFCHLCSAEELKARKKVKIQKLKADKMLAARQAKKDRRGVRLDGRNQMPNGHQAKHDGMTIGESPRKGLTKEHDTGKSDDETTQAPSENEITDTKYFSAPPGLELPNMIDMMFAAPPGLKPPGLSSTLTMHGLPPNPMRGGNMTCAHLSEGAYVNTSTPMNFCPGAVSVSFMTL